MKTKRILLTSKKMRAADKIGNRLTTYFNQYESQISKNSNIYDQYRTLLSNVQSGSYQTVEDMNNAFASFRTNARKAGVEVESFGSRMQQTFGVRVRSALVGEGVWMMESALRDIVKNTIDVDTAMTEVKKVTSETDSTYTKFLSDASGRAQNLGASLTEVVNATADYARLGHSLEEATGLADSAILYQNVGDDVASIDDATSSLISTMQGFGIAASDSMSIVDKFNNVSNNYASSAGNIGEIVKRSASAMAAANNDIDETIALGVAANTVVQDADVVGTALKTMSMRLRGSETELKSAGLDAEGMASSVSTLRDEVKSLSGVDIMLDEDNFKSSYQILMDIGKVWDNLQDVSQANILELLFGKRQGNIGAAILQNYELAEEILETSRDSAGSAEAENSKYLKSVQGHLDQLQARWQAFSTSIVDSAGMKVFIDVAGGIVSVLNGLTDAFGSVTMASLPFVGAMSKMGNLGKKYALLQQGRTSCRMMVA